MYIYAVCHYAHEKRSKDKLLRKNSLIKYSQNGKCVALPMGRANVRRIYSSKISLRFQSDAFFRKFQEILNKFAAPQLCAYRNDSSEL
jgi:hypothetical protein